MYSTKLIFVVRGVITLFCSIHPHHQESIYTYFITPYQLLRFCSSQRGTAE
jgi:hypothetical protein